MQKGLIGYSGFVGSNLDKQFQFNQKYNSSNIQELKGLNFELLVCAGPRSEKFLANQDPEADLENIKNLIEILKTVQVKQFILISTIDVYHNPVGVDEDTAVNPELTDAYGKNRFYFEEFVRSHFNNALVVRLPGLFGTGLKKNLIYDMQNRAPRMLMGKKFAEIINSLTDENKEKVERSYESQTNQTYKLKTDLTREAIKELEQILTSVNSTSLMFTHKDSIFQFYYLDNLWNDIQIALSNSLGTVNFATEPVSTGEVVRKCFDQDFNNVTEKPPFNYNIKTKYFKHYNGSDGYMYNKKQIFEQLINYLEKV